MAQLRTVADNLDTGLFDGEILISSRVVAESLNLSPRAFQRLIESGEGPPYFQFGKIKRFRPSTVRAWAAAHIEVTVAPRQAPAATTAATKARRAAP